MLEVYDELKIVVENTLKAIDRAYNEEQININDYNEMNVVIENADIDHLGLIMENILDVETIEDIEKYLN